MAELSPVARALLETISGPESAGSYNVKYGGSHFNDFSDHPRDPVMITSGPNKGQYSTAAGKYQFLGSTWDRVANEAGLTDFSPQSQDVGAWTLAKDEYRRDTGRDLETDLSAGDLSRVAPSLRDQWTSLPGGIEQGIGGNAFANAYAQNLGAPQSPAVAAIDGATAPRPTGLLASLMNGARSNIGGALNMVGSQAQPIMRSAQGMVPSIMKSALGTVAGRSAFLDPMIARTFTGGNPQPQAPAVQIMRAKGMSPAQAYAAANGTRLMAERPTTLSGLQGIPEELARTMKNGGFGSQS